MANDMKLQFNIGATFSELKAAVTQAKAEIKSLVDTVKKAGQDVKVKVSLDITGLNTDIQHLKTTIRTALQGSATEKIKVKIEADAAAIKADIAAIKPQIQSTLTALGHTIKIGIDLPLLQAQITQAKTLLSSLITPIQPLGLNINLASFVNQVRAAEHYLKEAIKRMSQAGSNIRLSINVDSMSTGLIAALNNLKMEVERLRLAMRSGQGGGSGGGGAPSVIGGVGRFRNVATTVITVLGISQLVQASDSAALLTARLKDLLGTEKEVAETKERLFIAAQKLQVGYEDMTKSAARLIPSMHNMGKTTDEAIKLSEILMTTAKLSGATTQEASNSAVQFSQALGSGVLQGDELRSILENNQALARALAGALKLPDSDMKVTIGMLRKLGKEGKITSEVMANALLKSYDSIMAKVDQLPNTFSGAWTRIKNTVFSVVDDLNQQEVFTGAIDGLNNFSNKIQELGKDGTIQEWAIGVFGSVGNAFSQLTGLIGDVFRQITSLWSDLTGSVEQETGLQITALDVLKGVINAVALAFVAARTVISGAITLLKQTVREVLFFIVDKFIWLDNSIAIASVNIETSLLTIISLLNTVWEIAKKAFVLDFSGAKKAWEDGTAELVKILEDRAAKIIAIERKEKSENTALAESKQQTREQTENDLANAGLKAAADAKAILLPPAKEPKKKADNKASQTLTDRVEVGSGRGDKSGKDILESQQKELAAQLKNLEAEYKNGDIKMRKYYADKGRLIAQIHQLEIDYLNKQSSAAKGKDKEEIDAKLKAVTAEKASELNINKMDLKKAIADAEKERISIKADIDTAAFEALNNKFDVKDKEIEAKYKEKLKKFEEYAMLTLSVYDETTGEMIDNTAALEAIAKESKVVDGLINSEKAKNNLDRIQEEIKTFIDLQANKVKSFEDKRKAGKITNTEAKTETDIVNEKTRDRLALYIAELEKIAPTSAEAKKNLEELRLKMLEIPPKKDAETEMQAFWNNINKSAKETTENAAKSGLSQFFMDIAEGAKSGTDAVRDFGRNFALSMAKVAADALAAWAVMKLVGLVGGFGGGGAAPMVDAPNLTANANVAHTGGIAGGALASRKVDMSLFNAAPRYHVGGIAGLQPGEVPAILQRGEEVLTQKDPRHVANGGGQGGGVRIINNIDPNIAHDYMVSSSGEQVIINHIERNSGTIRQILGV